MPPRPSSTVIMGNTAITPATTTTTTTNASTRPGRASSSHTNATATPSPSRRRRSPNEEAGEGGAGTSTPETSHYLTNGTSNIPNIDPLEQAATNTVAALSFASTQNYYTPSEDDDDTNTPPVPVPTSTTAATTLRQQASYGSGSLQNCFFPPTSIMTTTAPSEENGEQERMGEESLSDYDEFFDFPDCFIVPNNMKNKLYYYNGITPAFSGGGFAAAAVTPTGGDGNIFAGGNGEVRTASTASPYFFSAISGLSPIGGVPSSSSSHGYSDVGWMTSPMNRQYQNYNNDTIHNFTSPGQEHYSTGRERNSAARHADVDNNDESGVKVYPLLDTLLGIEFLPFNPNTPTADSKNSGNNDTPGGGELHINDTIGQEMEVPIATGEERRREDGGDAYDFTLERSRTITTTTDDGGGTVLSFVSALEEEELMLMRQDQSRGDGAATAAGVNTNTTAEQPTEGNSTMKKQRFGKRAAAMKTIKKTIRRTKKGTTAGDGGGGSSTKTGSPEKSNKDDASASFEIGVGVGETPVSGKKKKGVIGAGGRLRRGKRRNNAGGGDDLIVVGGSIVSNENGDGLMSPADTPLSVPSGDVQSEIDEVLRLIEADRLALEEHGRSLQSIEVQSESVRRNASEIVSRVRHVREEMANLHQALVLYVRALERDKVALEQNQTELARLDAERTSTELQLKQLEESVREGMGRVENLKMNAAIAATAAAAMTVGEDVPTPWKKETPSGSGVAAADDTSVRSGSSQPLPVVRTPPTGSMITDDEKGTSKLGKSPTMMSIDPDKSTPRAGNLLSPQGGVPPRRSTSLPLESAQPLPAASSIRRTASFIRAHDLDLPPARKKSVGSTNSSLTDSSTSSSNGLFFVDDDVCAVLDALTAYGHRMVTDEGGRWIPTKDTERILTKRTREEGTTGISTTASTWHHATGKEILVWCGKVDHTGFGSDLPVIKARGVIPTTARNLLELLIDSSRVKEYNKMSLGRKDELYLQKGFDTKKRDSSLGLKGEVKFIRSLNKPPLVRKKIEMFTVLHAQELDEDAGEKGGYLVVTRSVWESATAAESGGNGDSSLIRSEMLLGVNLIKPLFNGDDASKCELTTVTHAYSPSVPQGIAKRMAPVAAANFIRDIQGLWE